MGAISYAGKPGIPVWQQEKIFYHKFCIDIKFQVTLFLKIIEGGWCDMKRNRLRRFFQQKQYAIASLILFVAIAGMTGVYLSDKITSQKQETDLAQEEKEPEDRKSTRLNSSHP